MYLDGGTSDSIPLKFMEDKGYDKILVIETQPKEYLKSKQKFMPVIKRAFRKYPNMIKAMGDRYLMYNDEKHYVREREEKKEIFVIRPRQSLHINDKTKDPKEIQRVYDLGRQEALDNLEALKAFLS